MEIEKKMLRNDQGSATRFHQQIHNKFQLSFTSFEKERGSE